MGPSEWYRQIISGTYDPQKREEHPNRIWHACHRRFDTALIEIQKSKQGNLSFPKREDRQAIFILDDI